MATSLGTMTVKVEPELSHVFDVVIAATKLSEALKYLSFEQLRALPIPVQTAFGELRNALGGC